MNSVIKNILNSSCSEQDKSSELDSLSKEIEIAKNILSGKYKYCSECDDYFLAESFLQKNESHNGKICIYEDPINSGG